MVCSCKQNNIGRRVNGSWLCPHTSLTGNCSNILDVWDIKKNKHLTPNDFLSGSIKTVHVTCNICGLEKSTTPSALSNSGKYNCKQCYLNNNSAAKRFPYLINEVNDGTDLTKVTYGSGLRVNWKCKKVTNEKTNEICGHIWDATINSRTSMNQGCAKCARVLKVTYEEFLRRATEKHGTDYEYPKITSENFNIEIPIQIVCKKHGPFSQAPNIHMAGSRCPKCAHGTSKGNEKIEKILASRGKIFKTEKSYPDLRYKNHYIMILEIFLIPTVKIF
jgi:hypothetical protein